MRLRERLIARPSVSALLNKWDEPKSGRSATMETQQCSHWQLMTFLLGNGLNPLLIAQWAQAQPGWLRSKGAYADIIGILQKWHEGKMDGKKYFCMQTRTTKEIQCPGFVRGCTDGVDLLWYVPGTPEEPVDMHWVVRVSCEVPYKAVDHIPHPLRETFQILRSLQAAAPK